MASPSGAPHLPAWQSKSCRFLQDISAFVFFAGDKALAAQKTIDELSAMVESSEAAEPARPEVKVTSTYLLKTSNDL